MTAAVTGVAAVLAYAGALVGLRMLRSSPTRRVRPDADEPQPPRDPSPLARGRAAVGRRLGPLVLKVFDDARRRRVDRWLDAGGRPDRVTVERFAAEKAADVACGVLVGLAVSPWLPVALPAGLLWGWVRTDLAARGRARRRQARIERDLPDLLDVLAVSLQAGIGFRAALKHAVEQMATPVAEEFRTALRQIDLGATRRAAFEGLRDRNDSPSLRRVVAALLRAEELGAPLAGALSAIADDQRRAHAQRVRSHAARAEPKVSLVTTLVVMPAVLLLMVGGLVVGADLDLSMFP